MHQETGANVLLLSHSKYQSNGASIGVDVRSAAAFSTGDQ